MHKVVIQIQMVQVDGVLIHLVKDFVFLVDYLHQ